MTEHLKPEQIERLERIFNLLDKGRGKLNTRELGCVLGIIGVSTTEAELQDMINEVGGPLDLEDFKHLMTKRLADCDTVGEVNGAFSFFDCDGDGNISLQDASQGLAKLGVEARVEEVQEMMREADLNDDGKVSKLEFSKVIL